MPSLFQMTSIFFNNILNRIRILCVTFHYGSVNSNYNIVIQIAFIIFFHISTFTHTLHFYSFYINYRKYFIRDKKKKNLLENWWTKTFLWLTNFCVYKSIFYRFNFILVPFKQGIFRSFHTIFFFLWKILHSYQFHHILRFHFISE